ncbi:asparaginase [Saccharibacter sp. 17.LH.SD]|uniref:asparaginase n=1 Tax=Saccharibacter sp. 17.LH.SD TaxID=2689393 RepID=UPI0013684A60|nr:asparaginase [Saccharibacter sp. 17.LH.SD]MXV43752.1 asparaginase [Saccharibacter sp. 17.LH.SD]
MEYGLLAEVKRGGRVESRHSGCAVVVDTEGNVVWSLGDAERFLFPRSTVKAFLALELVASGAADRLGLGNDALALACASHGGEEIHTRLAASMLERVGHTETVLECGAHWPSYEPAARAWAAQGHSVACCLQNTCSGKHAGMVCLACDQGIDPAGYTDPDHEIQRRVTSVLEQVTAAPHRKENRGIDGCSLPTYAIPFRSLALGLARFGTGTGLEPFLAQASSRLRRAVAEHPFMVAGTDRYDTAIMERFGERAFVKMGAEGIMVAALPEEGLGIVVKAEDGAARAAEVFLTALLKRFGKHSLCRTEADELFLEDWMHRTYVNWRGIEVGSIYAVRP